MTLSYYARNKEKVAKRVLEYRRANPERRRKWEATQRSNNPDYYREKRKKYWAKELLRREEIAGPRPDKCEFCNKIGPVVFDHDHITGKFRSWPCKECNTVLGLVRDNPEVLRKMADKLDECKAGRDTLLVQECSNPKKVFRKFCVHAGRNGAFR